MRSVKRSTSSGRQTVARVSSDLAFGTASLIPGAESTAAITAARHAGVRCFDTAPYYGLGQAELALGEALAGVEIISLPAAFTRQTGEAHWEILIRARAIENGVFIIAAAQAGVHEDGRETFGHSMIVDPWGRILASAGGTGEAVIIADLDIAEVAAARRKIPNLKNAREFEVKEAASIDAAVA